MRSARLHAYWCEMEPDWDLTIQQCCGKYLSIWTQEENEAIPLNQDDLMQLSTVTYYTYYWNLAMATLWILDCREGGDEAIPLIRAI